MHAAMHDTVMHVTVTDTVMHVAMHDTVDHMCQHVTCVRTCLLLWSVHLTTLRTFSVQYCKRALHMHM